MPPKYPIELQLAAACCAQQHDRIGRLLAEPIHTAEFLRLVQRHRIAGLVERGLRKYVNGLSPECWQTLQQLAGSQTMQNMRTLPALCELMRACADAKIVHAVLKGPALSVLAYGEPLIRHSKDIDLFVAPEDVLRTTSLLEDLGYTSLTPGLHNGESAFTRSLLWAAHFIYVHPRTLVQVELHWRFTNNVHLLPLTISAERFEPVVIGTACAIPSLAGDDLVLYLCVHGATHAWFRLKWLVDVYMLLARYTPHDLARLAIRAEELDLTRPLQLSLDLMGEIFEAKWTVGWQTRHRNYLLDLSRRSLLGADDHDQNPGGSTPLSMSLFRLKHSLRYKVREALNQAANSDEVPGPFVLHASRRLAKWTFRKMRSRSALS